MKKTKKQQDKDLAIELLVEEVKNDFQKRQQEKKPFEVQWQLNMNYLIGNQYCDINKNGEIDEYDKRYYWQEREVYNHIAPIVEKRLSKLSRIRPKINLFPASNNEDDIRTAKISKKIVDSVYNNEDVVKVINETTKWSEICGSGFYKVIWNSKLGQTIANYDVGGTLTTGDVQIISISPFEIFPESSNLQDIESSRSIIHARAYHIDEIKNQWGVDVEGADINVFTLDKSSNFMNAKSCKSIRNNYAVVIERYEAPSIKYPNGRLVIVAGDKLLFVGELPYINEVNNKRGFPFIKQDAYGVAGCFWGTSVIERLIPLQKAYNALKNRKHEFFNRYSIGVLAVEDGSVDIENLEEDGVCPGKILVYRQGSDVPKYMENEKAPWNFIEEEKAILDEFTAVSGVSDLISERYLSHQLSGVAIELLIEQDENRMLVTIESIRNAIKNLGKHILRLYKQFVNIPRLAKIVGNNGDFDIFYFNNSDISSDDIIFETKNDMVDSFSQRKQLIFDLMEKDLFADEKGVIAGDIKRKIMEALGFGTWENITDLNELQRNRANKENYSFVKQEDVKVRDVDNHEIHINEHTAFIIGSDFDKINKKVPDLEKKIMEHIAEHKKLIIKKEI